MVKKESVLILGVMFMILFSLNLAFAIHVNSPSSFNVNLSQYFLYNITINNTNTGQSGNITQVNITLPSGFVFMADSNGSAINFTGNSYLTGSATFANTSSVLSWTNITAYLINGSSVKNYFWFNASAPSTPGFYNLSVLSLNMSGTTAHQSNITIRLQDTTSPVITLVSPENANSTIPSETIVAFTFNVTDSSSSGTTNCSLILNGNIVNSNLTVLTGLGNTVRVVFSNSSGYSVQNSWSINCTDSDNNKANSSTYSFSLISFSFNGTTKDVSGNALGSTNISVLVKNVAWSQIAVPSTTSNASGWFNLNLPLNSTYMYQATLIHTDTATNSVDYVGQSLPLFPYAQFSRLYNVNFYLQSAGTINITVRNSTNVLTSNFAVQVKDTRLGYPVSCSGAYGPQYLCYVPRNRNYSVMVYPSEGSNERFIPVYLNWNNFVSSLSYNVTDNLGTNYSTYNFTTKTLHKQFNVTQGLSRVTGYINGSNLGFLGNWTNFTVIPFILEPGNMISVLQGILPWNASAWNSQQTDRYNGTSGFYNITVPYSSAESSSYLFFATAGNGTNFFGSYRNRTISSSTAQLNFTMLGLLGENSIVNMSGSTGGTYAANTKRVMFNLVNSTNSSITSMSAHIETLIDYSSDANLNVTQFTMMYDLNGQGDANFSLPLLNISGISKMNIYSQTYAPKKISTRTSSQIASNSNFTMASFNPRAISGTVSSSSLNLYAYFSNATCDVPNPPAPCLLTSFTQATAEQNMLPIVIGGGAISLRMVYSGIAVHYVNVDLLASGPPDADFDSSQSESNLNSGFSSAMKFGSSGPTIYDYALVSVPYTPGNSTIAGLDESSQVNISLPLLYDEDYSTPIWNSSANGTRVSALMGNYSYYSSRSAEWQTLISPNNTCYSTSAGTDAINSTTPCHMQIADNRIWIRLPHFSGNSVSVTGGITTVVSSSASSTPGAATLEWVNSQGMTNEQFEAGYTKEFSAKYRATFTIGSTTHSAGVLSLTTTTATVQVSSSPQQKTMSIGEEWKVELTGDKYYDVSVKLNSIANNKASVTIKKINELMPETDSSATEEAEKEKSPELSPEEETKTAAFSWTWIIVAVIVIAVIAFFVIKKRKD